LPDRYYLLLAVPSKCLKFIVGTETQGDTHCGYRRK